MTNNVLQNARLNAVCLKDRIQRAQIKANLEFLKHTKELLKFVRDEMNGEDPLRTKIVEKMAEFIAVQKENRIE